MRRHSQGTDGRERHFGLSRIIKGVAAVTARWRAQEVTEELGLLSLLLVKSQRTNGEEQSLFGKWASRMLRDLTPGHL